MQEKGAKKTRERRAATHEQLLALLTADLSEQLLLAYALAAYNWLRQNELEDLTWDRVHLDATIPFGGLPQKQGSDHTLDYVPLHPFAVRLLRGRIGLGSARVLRSVPDVKTLRKDLGRGRRGVPRRQVAPARLPCCVRHTLEMVLDRVGSSRTTKKKLMRHTNEDVTDAFAHADLAETLAALERLAATSAVTAAATGPD